MKTEPEPAMPKEDRRIIFNNDEIYKALYALCTQKQIPKPPPGAVQNIAESKDDSGTVLLKLVNPQDTHNPEIEISYNRDFLAAALMLFCRGLGIPLPKSARKSVLIRGEQVMLRIQID